MKHCWFFNIPIGNVEELVSNIKFNTQKIIEGKKMATKMEKCCTN